MKSDNWLEKFSNWCKKFFKRFFVKVIICLIIFACVVTVIMIYQDRVTYFANIRNYHLIQNGKEKFDVLIEINKTIVSIIGTFASIVGTFATVIGALFLYLNFDLANKNFQLAMRKNATDKNLANKNFQLAIEKNATDKKVTELKLASERFSKATEQLASDKLPARLGAIYALENIAREHEDYHWIVVEVLSAFIRDKKEGEIVISDESKIEKQTLMYLKRYGTEYSLEISSDAQVALTVIGRRTVERDENRIIDLSRANLRKAYIDSLANFTNANFSKADLRDSILQGNFSEAYFERVRLDNATLDGANFQEAKILYAQLNGTDLIGTNLIGADFYYSCLNNRPVGKQK